MTELYAKDEQGFFTPGNMNGQQVQLGVGLNAYNLKEDIKRGYGKRNACTVDKSRDIGNDLCSGFIYHEYLVKKFYKWCKGKKQCYMDLKIDGGNSQKEQVLDPKLFDLSERDLYP